MSDPAREFRPRLAPGARLFVSEGAAAAMISHAESDGGAEGLMTGSLYRDDRGGYAVVTGIAPRGRGAGGRGGAVGWYRSVPGGGCEAPGGPADGPEGAFAAVIDPLSSSMAFFERAEGGYEAAPAVIMEP
ncbi:MAG: hypothetical protein LBG62_00645 [Candidatus Methanoplasma sp.]|jgi:hypothetical protein|nr:hypothetical protein [Candidatus Methanoplasma sp.]